MNAPENIPKHLAPATQAALSWINSERTADYSLTGLVGADGVKALTRLFEFGLVLCDGEICAREQIHVLTEMLLSLASPKKQAGYSSIA